jgi:hypothetical protein
LLDEPPHQIENRFAFGRVIASDKLKKDMQIEFPAVEFVEE